MARRIYGNGMIASVASVQTVEAILGQMQSGFQPKQDPFAELSREIEVRIWIVVMNRMVTICFLTASPNFLVLLVRNVLGRFGNV